MSKYIEVVTWYIQLHPIMFTVIAFALFCIALMFYNAYKIEQENWVTVAREDWDKED